MSKLRSDDICDVLTRGIAEERALMADIISRIVRLENQLAELLGQPDPDPAAIEALQRDIEFQNGELAAAQERLAHLEADYSFAGCATPV